MSATNAGQAMRDATLQVVGPLLQEHGISCRFDPMQVGVGIDIGKVVVTTVGDRNTHETTVYGPPVNRACKLHDGNSAIHISNEAKDAFPTADGGKASFKFLSAGKYRIDYPSDYNILL